MHINAYLKGVLIYMHVGLYIPGNLIMLKALLYSHYVYEQLCIVHGWKKVGT